MKIDQVCTNWKEFDSKTKMLDKLWNKLYYQYVVKGD
jgi:hypothetical protein